MFPVYSIYPEVKVYRQKVTYQQLFNKLNITSAYWCPCDNSYGHTNCLSIVFVTDPPREDRTYCRETSYSLALGDSLTVCCPVSGYPPPFITWKKNGVQLNEESFVLKLFNLKDEDFGNYTCSATDFRTSVGPLNITIKKKSGLIMGIRPS